MGLGRFFTPQGRPDLRSINRPSNSLVQSLSIPDCCCRALESVHMPQSWLAEAGATAGISKLAVEAGATAGISKLALEVGADVFLKVQSQDHRGLRSSRLGVQGRTALHSPVA